MKVLAIVLPVALLVAFSQIAIKWRMLHMATPEMQSSSFISSTFRYLSDPVIFTAYIAGFLASIIWLLVIEKLPLTLAFPVYIGVTIALVVIGGWFFLSESVTAYKVASVFFIVLGIILGVRS